MIDFTAPADNTSCELLFEIQQKSKDIKICSILFQSIFTDQPRPVSRSFSAPLSSILTHEAGYILGSDSLKAKYIKAIEGKALGKASTTGFQQQLLTSAPSHTELESVVMGMSSPDCSLPRLAVYGGYL